MKNINYLVYIFIAINSIAFSSCFASPTFIPVASFSPSMGNPGSLTQGSDGTFYGTTNRNGSSPFGGVFKLTSNGVLSMLTSFTQQTLPINLAIGSDGSLYGADQQTLNTSPGRIYKVSPTGVFTTLYTFTGGQDGGVPNSSLVLGSDGQFYGVTAKGGTYGQGTFFKISDSGVFTLIAPLTSALANEYLFYAPYPMLLGKDNNFYILSDTTLFKMTSTGQATILQTLPSTPLVPSALTQGSDGNFYYTVFNAGVSPNSSLVKVTSSGVVSTISTYADSGVLSSLVQSRDGNFYVTSDGGIANLTVIEILPSGASNVMSTTSSAYGNTPTSLIQGMDGTLYGTTQLGGESNSGVVFNFNPDLLIGTVIGTAGSWNNHGNTIEKVFDGSLTTFFDAPSPGNADWVGLDLGSSQGLSMIAFAPRIGYEKRMVGGVFQGSTTADFSSGVVNLTTPLSTTPGDGFTQIPVSGSYRYVRYLAPNGAYGNIAELEFFTNVAP